jgi:hypothetical protein
MSLLQKIIENKPDLENLPEQQSKADRLQLVVESILETLPLPAKILIHNFTNSSLPYNEENADKVTTILTELSQFIEFGVLPDGGRTDN